MITAVLARHSSLYCTALETPAGWVCLKSDTARHTWQCELPGPALGSLVSTVLLNAPFAHIQFSTLICPSFLPPHPTHKTILSGDTATCDAATRTLWLLVKDNKRLLSPSKDALGLPGTQVGDGCHSRRGVRQCFGAYMLCTLHSGCWCLSADSRAGVVALLCSEIYSLPRVNGRSACLH